jgi:hypothetical protein
VLIPSYRLVGLLSGTWTVNAPGVGAEIVVP